MSWSFGHDCDVHRAEVLRLSCRRLLTLGLLAFSSCGDDLPSLPPPTDLPPDIGSTLPQGCGDGIIDPELLCFETKRLVWPDLGFRLVSSQDVLTTDLDEDGRQEFLCQGTPTDSDSEDLFLLAYDGGEFRVRWQTAAGSSSFGFAEAGRDIDRDGDRDVLLRSTTGWVAMYTNEGGTLSPIETLAEQASFGGWLTRGAPIPFDRAGDGIIDSLIETIWEPAEATGAWYFSANGAGWEPESGPIALAGCQTLGESAWGDFNRDGIDDIVVRDIADICDPHIPEYDPNWWQFYLFLGRQDGGLDYVDSFPSGGIFALGTFVIDFDQDGSLDVILSIPNGASFIRGRGDGSFDQPRVYQPLPGSSDLSLAAIADFDGDGRSDALVSLEEGLAITPLVPDLQPQRFIHDRHAANIEVADLNGDSISDIMFGDPSSEDYPHDRIVLLSTP